MRYGPSPRLQPLRVQANQRRKSLIVDARFSISIFLRILRFAIRKRVLTNPMGEYR